MSTPEAQDSEGDTVHIGQIRVSFAYDRCSDATIVAKQCYSEQKNQLEMTFKPYGVTKSKNKKLENVEEDSIQSCFSLACCFLCVCVNGFFKTTVEDVIDHAADGAQT